MSNYRRIKRDMIHRRGRDVTWVVPGPYRTPRCPEIAVRTATENDRITTDHRAAWPVRWEAL